MRQITQPIRDVHQEQITYIEKCSQLADSIGEMPPECLAEEIDQVVNWLQASVLPLIDAEDRILYPTIAVILGAPQATNTMRVDHAEFRSMARELISIRSRLPMNSSVEDIKRLRRLLYGLHTLLRLHIQKEEQVYFGIIDDHLTSEQGRRLLEAMELEQEHRLPVNSYSVRQWASV